MSYGDLLRLQREHLTTLLDLLRHEQALLVQGGAELEALEAVARDKQQQLAALDALERQRQGHQQALGDDTPTSAAEKVAVKEGVLGLWQDVLDKTRRAAHLNRLNGSLVQQRLCHNKRVLDTLLDLASSRLYDADGYARGAAGRVQSRA